MDPEQGRRLPYFLLQEIAARLRHTIIHFNSLDRQIVRERVVLVNRDLAECLAFYTSEVRDPIVRVEDLAPLLEHLPADNP